MAFPRRVAEGAAPWNAAQPKKLTAEEIRRLFALLDTELARDGVHAELFLVGGAVMCLALGARDATRDVDALLRPAKEVRAAAARVAARAGVSADWLNDAVKGFLGEHATFDHFLELAHLRVYVARTDYLLAMKCMAMRLDEGVSDSDDVRFLLKLLDIRRVEDALAIVERYFDGRRIPLKTQLVLEELLPPPPD